MIQFQQKIETFTALICIERKLKHDTPQFQMDAFNAVVAVEGEEVYEVDWQSFTNPDEIPTEVIYIKFWDNDQAFTKDSFNSLWLDYRVYFNSIFKSEPDRVPERTEP